MAIISATGIERSVITVLEQKQEALMKLISCHEKGPYLGGVCLKSGGSCKLAHRRTIPTHPVDLVVNFIWSQWLHSAQNKLGSTHLMEGRKPNSNWKLPGEKKQQPLFSPYDSHQLYTLRKKYFLAPFLVLKIVTNRVLYSVPGRTR